MVFSCAFLCDTTPLAAPRLSGEQHAAHVPRHASVGSLRAGRKHRPSLFSQRPRVAASSLPPPTAADDGNRRARKQIVIALNGLSEWWHKRARHNCLKSANVCAAASFMAFSHHYPRQYSGTGHVIFFFFFIPRLCNKAATFEGLPASAFVQVGIPLAHIARCWCKEQSGALCTKQKWINKCSLCGKSTCCPN